MNAKLFEGGKSLRVRKEDLLQLLEHVAKQDAMDEQTRARFLFANGSQAWGALMNRIGP